MINERFDFDFRNDRFTYEIAPVFILMEHEVLKKMRHIIGFYDGDSILAPGLFVNLIFFFVVVFSCC